MQKPSKMQLFYVKHYSKLGAIEIREKLSTNAEMFVFQMCVYTIFKGTIIRIPKRRFASVITDLCRTPRCYILHP
jgi:hypothetical protein